MAVDRHDADIETQGLEPVCQGMNHREVTLVKLGQRATDAGQSNQFGNHGFQRWYL